MLHEVVNCVHSQKEQKLAGFLYSQAGITNCMQSVILTFPAVAEQK